MAAIAGFDDLGNKEEESDGRNLQESPYRLAASFLGLLLATGISPGLTNCVWCTVTPNATLDSTPLLTDRSG